jgi:uncharacterized protein (UPF0332 family)
MPAKTQTPEDVRQKAYAEALRYMSNAKETLQKARKEDDNYHDVKYVRTACGTAYNGVLIALDAYLLLKGIEQKKGRKSIEYYTANISNLDKKLMGCVNNAYKILHLSGYYDGTDDAVVVKRGFDYAYQIIDKIKPEHVQELPPSKPSPLKRIYTFLYLTCFIPCWHFFSVVGSLRLKLKYQ